MLWWEIKKRDIKHLYSKTERNEIRRRVGEMSDERERWRQAEGHYSLIRCRRRRHLPDEHPLPFPLSAGLYEKHSQQKITTLKNRASVSCSGQHW